MSNVTASLADLFVNGPRSYISRALDLVNVVGAFFIAGINYWLFPDRGLMVSLGCVLLAAILDIGTRYLAVKKRRGRGHWQSEKFWEGTSVKLVAYLVIALLAGISYRLTPFLQQPTVYLWSVAYIVMFLREVQSNIENLVDMGADVGWLGLWAKRQERRLLEVDGTPAPSPGKPEEEGGIR